MRTRQFDLFSVLEWTAAIAFVVAVLSGAGAQISWTYRFSTLPSDDVALEKWLVQNDNGNIRVKRHEDTVTLEKRSRAFMPVRFDDLPRPPWQDLGYAGAKGQGGSTTTRRSAIDADGWSQKTGALCNEGLRLSEHPRSF